MAMEEFPLGIQASEAVGIFREEAGLVFFTGIIEGVDELEGVVGMDVIIDEAVHNEQMALELVDIVQAGA